MNNQFHNIDTSQLSFGNMPMDYHESTNIDPGIFNNKGGTSISDIMGKKINVNNNNVNNIPAEKMMQQQKMLQQMQQQKMAQQKMMLQQQLNKQVVINPEPDITEYTPDNDSTDSQSKEIYNMAKEINKSLEEYTTSKIISEESEDVKQECTSFIPNILKEPIIIFILYVILSQTFFRKILSNAIPETIIDKYNLSKTTVYIIIYGLVLSLLFMLVKKLILN